VRRQALLGIAGLAFTAALATSCQWHLTTRTPPAPDAAIAPEFSLPDADGKPVALSALLEKGPVVVVFYRGYW